MVNLVISIVNQGLSVSIVIGGTSLGVQVFLGLLWLLLASAATAADRNRPCTIAVGGLLVVKLPPVLAECFLDLSAKMMVIAITLRRARNCVQLFWAREMLILDLIIVLKHSLILPLGCRRCIFILGL